MCGRHRISLSTLLMIALGLAVARADQGPPPPRLITVTGSAEVKVPPDEVTISVGVVTVNKNLIKSKEDNDKRTKRVLEIAEAIGVPSTHIQTDYVRIGPDYDHRHDERVFLGHEVRQVVAITLRDIDKYESLLTSLVGENVDHIHGVSFRLSQSRPHKDLARQNAIRAAKEKAVALAAELGQTIGRPHAIVENTGDLSDFGGPWWNSRSSRMSNTAVQIGDGGDLSVVAPGQIVVRANVTVSFELVDAE